MRKLKRSRKAYPEWIHNARRRFRTSGLSGMGPAAVLKVPISRGPRKLPIPTTIDRRNACSINNLLNFTDTELWATSESKTPVSALKIPVGSQRNSTGGTTAESLFCLKRRRAKKTKSSNIRAKQILPAVNHILP